MIELLTTLAVCFVSAFIPLVNAEVYLAAITATDQGVSVWPLALAAAVGQMLGKIVWYEAGRHSLRWSWMRRRLDTPKWQTRYATWQGRVTGRPFVSALVLLTSAFVGVPPFALMSVLAGQLRMPFWLFVVAGLIGRLGRFALVVAGISLIPWNG